MKLYKDTLTAVKNSLAMNSLAKRYLLEIHSTKSLTPRFAVVGNLDAIPYKRWEILKVYQPTR